MLLVSAPVTDIMDQPSVLLKWQDWVQQCNIQKYYVCLASWDLRTVQANYIDIMLLCVGFFKYNSTDSNYLDVPGS